MTRTKLLVYLDRNGGRYPWFIYDRDSESDYDGGFATLQEAFEVARRYAQALSAPLSEFYPHTHTPRRHTWTPTRH